MAQYQEHNGSVNSSASLKMLYTYADPDHGSRLTSITDPNGTTSTLTYSYGTAGTKPSTPPHLPPGIHKKSNFLSLNLLPV